MGYDRPGNMHKIKKIALLAVGDEAWQGGIQYIINIINGLNSIADPGLEVHLFKHAVQKFDRLEKFGNLRLELVDSASVFKPFSINNRIKWFAERKFAGRINPRMEEYFLTKEYDYVYPGLFSGKLNSGSWIADFQCYHYPDGTEGEFGRNAQRFVADLAERSSKLILSSKFCENDCHHFFPFTAERTHVMPFSVYIDPEALRFDDFEEILTHYCLPRRFLVVANLFAPTKNHTTLFDALGILKKEGLIVNLICTGNIVDYRNQTFANEILQMITKNRIRDQVHLLGLIPRQHQLAIFRMAAAMVQPSLNEGWSTPVEEAKALGMHLLLSDIALHKEQYPGNPYFFEALNAEDLAGKIRRIWIENENIPFPGKDTGDKAYTQYQHHVEAFGRKFLEIASS
jgi:glycosyltransferase involved in cell wall biosynthesis